MFKGLGTYRLGFKDPGIGLGLALMQMLYNDTAFAHETADRVNNTQRKIILILRFKCNFKSNIL